MKEGIPKGATHYVEETPSMRGGWVKLKLESSRYYTYNDEDMYSYYFIREGDEDGIKSGVWERIEVIDDALLIDIEDYKSRV